MFVEDLFGEVVKEWEVEKIVNKFFEVKICKSFDIYEILVKFVGMWFLIGLVFFLKEVGF